MTILTLTDSLLQTLSATDRRIYRDRILCGFCLQTNKRTRTFLVATSVQGKQFRMRLGRWPLISVEEARALAVEALRECRAGRNPAKAKVLSLPTLKEALTSYCNDKTAQAIKPQPLRFHAPHPLCTVAGPARCSTHGNSPLRALPSVRSKHGGSLCRGRQRSNRSIDQLPECCL